MSVLTVWRNGKKITVEFDGATRLVSLLAANNLGVVQPCGGRGACRKCAIEITGDISPETDAEKQARTRLACQITCLGDCEATLPDTTYAKIETNAASRYHIPVEPFPGEYGAAADIGTTTVVLKLFDLRSGECLAVESALNPQNQIASDVIGRISAALNGSAVLLRDRITDCLESLLSSACAGANIARDAVKSFVLTGNTTMLYLLTLRDTRPLSRAPFEADCLFGVAVEILGGRAYLPSCMDAFVGADITCAVLASAMCERSETSLLIDIGTNGEIALWHEGKLYVSSTAAGPAFEGAGIACGCGSVPGAIDKAWRENNTIGVSTIDGKDAVGICGSGLIDIIAALLELEWVDETGAADADKIPISNGVYIDARDVRSVQLAKGAIAAGIQTMLQTVGVKPEQVETLYIAGGFGSHINISSAVRIGLIPKELASRVRVLGNAALSGAETLLFNRSLIAQTALLAQNAQTIRLSGNPVFSEQFMEQMLFA